MELYNKRRIYRDNKDFFRLGEYTKQWKNKLDKENFYTKAREQIFYKQIVGNI